MHIYQRQKIHWFYELLSLAFIVLIISWLYFNWKINALGYQVSNTWTFLSSSANFFISDHWLPFSPKDPTWYAILIASVNTFILGMSVMMSATVFGFLFGILSAYPKYKLQWFASSYVDVFRNTPLVGQLFFWYFGVFYLMPQTEHIYYDGFVKVSIQSLSIYTGNLFFILSFFYLIVGIYFLFLKRAFGMSLSFLLMSFIYFNFSHSHYFTMSVEWLALYTTLTFYTASYIAEIVKASLLSVPNAIDDAAIALGLNDKDKFKLVIYPIALKSMRPMLINQYITIMKNTSIGMLIGYPELMNVLTGTIINSTGQTLICVSLMMCIYLSVCLFCQFLFMRKHEPI
ncbi:MAG: ABC transporter permease subunit [Gammaproteobacteria bacterium]|nr:ABC transporter permease subunit [Gammaproteobacteria bacterium]